MKELLLRFKKFQKSKWFPYFCWFWLGLFNTLAFLPWKLSHFVWLSPFALFWLEKYYRGRWKKLIWHGLSAGVTTTVFSYFWMNHLLQVFGGFPFLISFILFILYAFVTNTRYAVFLVLFSFLRKRLKKNLFLLSGFCILVAELFTFQLFPYYFGNLIGGSLILSQNVEITGVYGLSALVFIVSYFLFRILENPNIINRIVKRKRFTLIKVPALALVYFFIQGTILYIYWSRVEPIASKNVIMIQPNAPLEFRDGREKETLDELMERIEALAIKAAIDIKPDIIVLPESAVPFFSTHKSDATMYFNRSYYERFESLIYLLSNRFKANVYFNEIDAMFVNNEVNRKNQRFYNSSAVFNPNGERGESYYKSYLLAFGEYFPLGETFPILYDLVPQVARFLPGTEQKLLSYYDTKEELPKFDKSHIRWTETNWMNLDSIKKHYESYRIDLKESGKFLPLICYEVIIPEFVRKFANAGNPDFIINITNDKWYGKSMETFQHLELARFRSIELRRWMVRSTNSGTSVYVDHLGRVLNNRFTGQETSEYYSAKIDVIHSSPTFYARFGNLVPYTYMVIFAFFSVWTYWKKK
ncbi:MAG: nitrilase-related carbon-nitrogen hydrolase [Leptospiraceae bacterium]|nr:nitrilase-related carbon-nitrogen hydrolase [Leptospiraceae bacterium]